MADLERPRAAPRVDPAVDDQAAADPAADGHVEDRRAARPRRRSGPRPARRCRRRSGPRRPATPEVLADPVGQREIRPSPSTWYDVVITPRSASTGPPKPMPDGRDLRRGRAPAQEQAWNASTIWSRMPAAPRPGSTVRRSRASDRAVAMPEAELELRAADLDARGSQSSAMRGLSARSRRWPATSLAGDPAVEVVDDPVEDDLVQRLDDPHVVDRRVQVVLGQRLELAAAEPGDAHGRQPVGVGPLHRLEDVRAVARARDRQQQVARRGQVLELLDEDPVVALVVGPGHDPGGVVGQAQDLEPLLVLEVAERALGQVLAEVRGVGARAAVAA